jgi:hypothetical protein
VKSNDRPVLPTRGAEQRSVDQSKVESAAAGRDAIRVKSPIDVRKTKVSSRETRDGSAADDVEAKATGVVAASAAAEIREASVDRAP